MSQNRSHDHYGSRDALSFAILIFSESKTKAIEPESMRKRPHILIFQTDQLAAPALGLYGGFAKTPNLESLAREGVVFDNAYCNYPLCAPSRFSMLTGQLATSIGAFDNAAQFPVDLPTFAHYLRRVDYRTCLSGKMHFIGPNQLHGFEERLTTDIYPADFAWLPDWDSGNQAFAPIRNTIERGGVCAWNMQLAYDEDVTFQAGLSEPPVGQSLMGILTGTADDWPDRVLAEYTAEAPMVMIRRGVYKYIHSEGDPPLLYDLAADPDELQNLAKDPEQASRCRDFAREVAARWELTALDSTIRLSQRRRALVGDAMARGGRDHWDYEPQPDYSKIYVRTASGAELADRRVRVPAKGYELPGGAQGDG
jgi:arylsulfatase A-like enzyme